MSTAFMIRLRNSVEPIDLDDDTTTEEELEEEEKKEAGAEKKAKDELCRLSANEAKKIAEGVYEAIWSEAEERITNEAGWMETNEAELLMQNRLVETIEEVAGERAYGYEGWQKEKKRRIDAGLMPPPRPVYGRCRRCR